MYKYTQSAFFCYGLNTYIHTDRSADEHTHVRTHLLKQEILTGKTI